MSMVHSMFQAKRNLFQRNPTRPLPSDPAQTHAAKTPEHDAARHPAMRCLSVPPVHGHHCICDRCTQHRAA